MELRSMGRENMHLVQNQGLDARSRLTISFRVVLHPLSSRAQEDRHCLVE